jgi:DNA polymerase III subunit alpha
MAFVHLHVHTHYSILDGAAPIKRLFERAHQDNQIALAITDHGNMFGVKEFLDTAAKYPGVKPIVGCEVYVAKGSRFDKRGKEDQGNYHLILLAKIKRGTGILSNYLLTHLLKVFTLNLELTESCWNVTDQI